MSPASPPARKAPTSPPAAPNPTARQPLPAARSPSRAASKPASAPPAGDWIPVPETPNFGAGAGPAPNHGFPPAYPMPPANPWAAWSPPPAPTMAPMPSWLKRTFRLYIYGVIAVMLLMGVLFLVNVFAPLGRDNLGRSGLSALVLALAWGWGIFGAFMMRAKPLVPAGFLGMATGVVGLIVWPMEIWDVGRAYDLTDLMWGVFWMQAIAAASYCAVRAFQQNDQKPLAMVSLAFAALGALAIAVGLAMPDTYTDGDNGERLIESGFGLALPLCAASTLLLLPLRPRLRIARVVAYAGFVELAVFLGVNPWVNDTDMLRRLNLAAVAIAIILGLVALSFYLIDALGLRRDEDADEPAGRGA